MMDGGGVEVTHESRDYIQVSESSDQHYEISPASSVRKLQAACEPFFWGGGISHLDSDRW